ncbi:DUF4229 domain-containing protein [Antiquaquibacter soli]|uniref:DUF4229 domain-containing protein n=1 Tax=Antiquaquibacter soli TaxID=3064523 RepID=A0ABT9BIN0_9MICO|nr:DUF4229 domain-containing protein [Protaetiibacter sp. WY-16]MDO7880875.1 DUF4229 domain-containing protein [Protaetiibacter sp. WY-16]
MKPWVAYSLLRVGLFAAAFAVLMLLGIEWWLSAILAAVIGLCVSYIFFGRLRERVALDIAQRRDAPARDVDAEVEDVREG